MSQQAEPRGNDAFGYQPALDGLRAVAVVVVLLFHQGFTWMTGGYVGVSVFFTLSGYLITSLLVLEHRSTGRVALGAFYRRRVKRLMPASLLCLSGVSVLAWAGRYPNATALRGDVVGAALQVANWRALTRGVSYAQLIQGGASPVDHFWSLAVEEQVYWVWPLAFMGLAYVSRRRGSMLVAVTAIAAAAVVAAPLIAAHWGPDVAYWSTPARLGEILVGAALAVWLDRWRARPTWWRWIAWPSLALVLWAAVALPIDHGLAYQGWFGAGSLITAALILGLQTHGVLRTLLSTAPLVWLGRLSYGVYLYHWPIYLLLDERTVGRHGVVLFALRAACTMVVALCSYVLVESPVRRSALPMPVVAWTAGLATAAVLVAALLMVPVSANGFGADDDLAGKVSIAATTGPLPTFLPVETWGDDGSSASTVLPALGRPVRILMLGDSTAEALSAGVMRWAAEHPDLAQVDSLAQAGCGFIRAEGMEGDDTGAFEANCRQMLATDLPVVLRDRRPDLVVILVTLPDVLDRQWSPSEGLLHSTDTRYAQRQLHDYGALAETLMAVPDLRVAWLTAAPPASWCVCDVRGYTVSMWAGQTAAIDAQVAAYPGRIERVNFRDWITNDELDGSRVDRHDGLHLAATSALVLMDERLARALLQIAAGSFG